MLTLYNITSIVSTICQKDNLMASMPQKHQYLAIFFAYEEGYETGDICKYFGIKNREAKTAVSYCSMAKTNFYKDIIKRIHLALHQYRVAMYVRELN